MELRKDVVSEYCHWMLYCGGMMMKRVDSESKVRGYGVCDDKLS